MSRALLISLRRPAFGMKRRLVAPAMTTAAMSDPTGETTTVKRTIIAGLATGTLLVGILAASPTPTSTPAPVVTSDVALAASPADRARCEGQEIPRRITAVIRSGQYRGQALANAIRQATSDARADCLRRFPPDPTTTPKPTSTTPKPTSTTPKPTSTTPKPTSTTPKPTSTVPLPTTTTPASPGAAPTKTLTCENGATMTYESVATFTVSFSCENEDPTRYFGYKGRGKFIGNMGISLTCPMGYFQATSQGNTQGSANNDYYVPQRSADGRTVSYRFYTGNDQGQSAPFYVSGECLSTPEPTSEPDRN